MNIFANTVVTLTFELYDSEGTLLEATDEPITYLHGGHSGMLPKLEEALNLKKVGDAVSVDVEPVDAFGDYDPELVKVEVPEAAPSSPSPTSPRARSCSTATIRGRASGCASIAGSSTCVPQRPRNSSTAMCTAPVGTTTEVAESVGRSLSLYRRSREACPRML